MKSLILSSTFAMSNN